MMDNYTYYACFVLLISLFVAGFALKSHLAVPVSIGNKRINKEPTIIIAGPSNSGKTSLFNLLVSGDARATVMSQSPNVSSHFMLPTGIRSARFKLIDFPGHVKLRHMLMTALNESTDIKGIMFVVDSTVDPKSLGETAELLYEILSITERTPTGIEILLACNKSESFTTRPPQKIKSALEEELDKVFTRRKRNLKTVSLDPNLEGNSDLLDVMSSSKFNFSLLEGNVEVKSGSVLKGSIDQWESWIDAVAMN